MGIPIGFGVIVFTVVITAFYVLRANKQYDDLSHRCRAPRGAEMIRLNDTAPPRADAGGADGATNWTAIGMFGCS